MRALKNLFWRMPLNQNALKYFKNANLEIFKKNKT